MMCYYLNVQFQGRRVNAQNYRNWELKVKRSSLLVSDGESVRGAVSTAHCYQKHLSDSRLPIRIRIYEILSEHKFMELYIFLIRSQNLRNKCIYPYINPYPTAFPYGNGMVLHFYQQQESSTTKTVHRVINKGLKTYV